MRYIKGWFCGFGISESNFVDLCRMAEAVRETREMIPGYLTKHPVAATPPVVAPLISALRAFLPAKSSSTPLNRPDL